ncbi:GNAT family N-acetyltransferase [Streptococcus suis]|uniref:GNAT family N-acetyltransferase n=1 Tax=Streptococcus suis TaxID=1307 RepID=UPI0009A4334A|nr:GNAT family N-acetyltransferase [Streptococcus suis]NQG20457.1 GNAT family N-acetyltransferase [Streptococcus suis]NQH62907.1 GNAT family N-acetyltransferase [Streptococcus suis]NQN12316.1 GNAT family N-acetyltransferase [Streptococcus suis]NQN61917.1 GNAT family N-acetyltransferase [Streptococcus suis]NQO47349.1 GNAT family N-acetyltransferase [Streptococcus suis]
MFRGSGLGSNLVKLVIDDLANRNSKAFQIAVEEENLGTWKLYKKLVLKNRMG